MKNFENTATASWLLGEKIKTVYSNRVILPFIPRENCVKGEIFCRNGCEWDSGGMRVGCHMARYLVACVESFNLVRIYTAIPTESLRIKMKGGAHTVFIKNFNQAPIGYIAVIITKGKSEFTAIFVAVIYYSHV